MALTAQVRAADAAVGAVVGEAALIARASAAVAGQAIELLGGAYGRRVLVLAGSGHNGADAVWAGARLAARGAAVQVLRTSSRDWDEHGAAAAAALLGRGGRVTAAGKDLMDQVAERGVDLVLDGMVGVGSSGELTGTAAEVAIWLRTLDALVLAVDIPSGVDADTGAAGVHVRADVTVTFGSLKPGLLLGAGAGASGQVALAEIGLGVPAALGDIAVLDADDVESLLPLALPDDDKYSRGVVGVLAGSGAYPGAALLAAGNAVRAGAGYVRAVGDPATVVDVVQRFPSVVPSPGAPVDAGRVDAWVVGPGLAATDEVRTWVGQVLAVDVPVVLDAAGLDLAGAAAIRARRGPTLVTPHAREFQRLTGLDPALDPVGSARQVARDLGAHVLLKGYRTVLAAPDGSARINLTGSPWLSTAGTGDVLSGALGAMLAYAAKRGSGELLDVAAAAAFVHGLAGHLAAGDPPAAPAADDLLRSWASAVRALRTA